MYKGKRILAIIPARGGSKGVPKKNIIDIQGQPLIQYSIDCALETKYIDKVVVSTDNEEIAKVAIDCGAEVPFLRPDHLATDTAKTIDAIIHTIDMLKNIEDIYDYVVTLQPTSPLRKSWHIDEAVEKLINSEYVDLVSISEVEDHPILMRRINDNGELENLLNLKSTVRRQDFPKIYKVNGAIYVNKLDENFNSSKSLNDANFSYIMESRYSTDIDTYLDIKKIEYHLSEEETE